MQMRLDLGFPSPALQAEFDKTQKRIQGRKDRFYGITSAVVPIDPSKLTEDGKAHRSRVQTPSQQPKALRLDAILERVGKGVPVRRSLALPYEEARIVVDAIYQRELLARNRYPIWNEETDLILERITRYFIGDPGDPTRPDVDWIPLTKCVFLYGAVGVGKTFLFRIMRTLTQVVPINEMAFQIVSAKKIILAVHNAKSMAPIGKLHAGGLLIDDLGEEKKQSLIYGEAQDPMDHLLGDRYESYIETGLPTHFTSNVMPGELEEIYGTRNYDRLLEMTVPILFPGTSKRPDDEEADDQ
jgi:hypothetical protein